MARLSANGTEIVRLVKEAYGWKSSTIRDYVDPDILEVMEWRKRSISIRSTGVILSKYQVKFRADMFGSGEVRDYGWKRVTTIKLVNLDNVILFYERRGYKKV